VLEDLGNLGDFLGGLAVIATLIYLAVQVRQNSQQIAQNSEWLKAQASHADLGAQHATTSLIATNADLASIFYRGNSDPDELGPEEWLRFVTLLAPMVGNYQSAHYQWTKGLLEDEQWNSLHQNSLKVLLRTPGGRRYWELFSRNHDSQFRAYVDAKVMKHASPAA
jgi:hypothetical protein